MLFLLVARVRGDGMMWGRKKLQELIARLERRLDQLDERNQLQRQPTADVVAKIRRPDGLAGKGRTDAAIGDQVAKLVGLCEQIFALTSRLDADVVAGFASYGKRLETDLIILAEQSRQLGGIVSQLGESSRLASGTLAKLAADQIQSAGGARQNGTGAGSRSAPAITAAIEPPIVPLNDADLPAAVRTWLTAHDDAPNQPIWCLDQRRLPQTPDALPGLIELMAACHRRLQPGERLVWAQPVEREPLLALNEIEQVLGLVGAVQGPTEVADNSKTWQVARATRRIEAAGIVLRWSIPALEALHIRLRPLAEEMLDRLALREAAHAIDLPEPEADLENWARFLPSVVATVCTRDNVAVGVTLPTRFDEVPQVTEDALARLRQALRDGGKTDEITFQWVRGSVGIAKSSAVLDFARRHGIGFDLTPVSRAALGSRLAAYDDRQPYRALPFDLRLPSYAAPPDATVEIPRWSGRLLDTHIADNLPSGLGAFFDAEFEQGQRRLARVLDRAAQKQFELQVNLDTTQMDYWPYYFVHNWSLPAPAWLRIFEFDAGGIFSGASPLLRVDSDTRLVNGSQFFSAAKAAMRVPTSEDLRRIQIEIHSYQRERLEITADAERLVAWMPESLGFTLELGSGLGVMARRLRSRASSYIGFDLTLDQAAELRKLGGLGLIADMRALPFPDSVFDTIVADNVIEHAADPLQALSECGRVLKPGGLAFLVIPPDYRRPEFCNKAHLWKADETSVREAAVRAGLRVVRQETVHLAEIGVGGAYPSSDGQTGLWQVEKPPPGSRQTQ